MRIAHITDLHYSTEKSTYEYRKLLEALMESLLEEHAKKTIDLVLITGDLLDKAGAVFGDQDGYKILEENVLSKIATDLGLPKGRIIIIPGNHDVKMGDKDQYYRLQGFRSNTDVQNINDIADDYWFPLDGAGSVNDSDPSRDKKKKKMLPALEAYKAFEQKFYEGFPATEEERKQLTSLESYFVVNFNGAKVGIAAFNSAWSCHPTLDREIEEGEEPSREQWKYITFGTRQIQRAADFFGGKTDINIALIHHPITPHFYGPAEEKEIKAELQRNNFYMLFCGHTHKIKDEIILTPWYNHYLIVTKSTFSDPTKKKEEYSSGFSLIDLTYLNDTHLNITRHFRKYWRYPGKFGTDNEIFDSKHATELSTKNLGKPFIEYLKKQDLLHDHGRKMLFDTINKATQQYLKSEHSYVTDLALKKLIEKLLPASGSDRSFHIRQKFRLNITIGYIDDQYYSLIDHQRYDILPNGKEPVNFHTFTYVDVDANRTDKSSVEIKSLVIDEVEYKDKYVKVPKNLDDPDIPLCRETYVFEKKLEKKSRHEVERKLHATNSLKLNKAWKIEVVNIYHDYEITVSNPDKKYLVEVFNLESGQNASNLDDDGKINDRPISIKKADGILTPGDTILIIVNLY